MYVIKGSTVQYFFLLAVGVMKKLPYTTGSWGNVHVKEVQQIHCERCRRRTVCCAGRHWPSIDPTGLFQSLDFCCDLKMFQLRSSHCISVTHSLPSHQWLLLTATIPFQLPIPSHALSQAAPQCCIFSSRCVSPVRWTWEGNHSFLWCSSSCSVLCCYRSWLYLPLT